MDKRRKRNVLALVMIISVALLLFVAVMLWKWNLATLAAL